MAVNKVVMNTATGVETLIDLTEDTVTPETLLAGATAHNARGELIVGTIEIPTKVSELENDAGYIGLEDIKKEKESGTIDNEILVLKESELKELSQEALAEKRNKGTKIIIVEEDAENLVPLSTDSDGTVYYGRGYRNDCRLKSDGSVVEARHLTVTGFIPCEYGLKIGVVGWGANEILSDGGQYIGVFGEDYSPIEIIQASSILSNGVGTEKNYKSIANEIVVDTSKRSLWSAMKYIRVSCKNTGENIVVTVSE